MSRLLRWLYNALLLAALVLLAPVWLVWLALSPRLRRGFAERLAPLPASAPGTVWLHAGSVGEVESAVPLLEALAERGVPLLATTLTATGRERLRARMPGLRVRLAPLDLPGLVQRSLAGAGVAVVVLVETEIWPNTIWAARAAGAEVCIVGARLSDASFRSYRRLRRLFAAVLRDVRVAARSEDDRDRFRALGVPVDRATVGGDLKLDRPAPGAAPAALLAALGPGPFLVGGSTHPGEEEALVSAFRGLRAAGASELRLILAPRHPERVPQVRARLAQSGLATGLRSSGAAACDVVILDTLGELSAVYGLADLVFCGGTLAPVGGHNLIEPVQAGKVIVHGPHVENQRSQVELLEPLGVLHAVAGADGLLRALLELWSDPRRHEPAERAVPLLAAHRGATERALGLVLRLRERAIARERTGTDA